MIWVKYLLGSAPISSLNILKTEFMVISLRQRIATLEGDISLSINRVALRRVKSAKCLVLNIDEFLTWNSHTQSLRHEVTCNVQVIRRVKPFLSLRNLVTLYRSTVEPYFSYGCIVWDGIGNTLSSNLQKLKNRAARILTSAEIRSELSWISLAEMRQNTKP